MSLLGGVALFVVGVVVVCGLGMLVLSRGVTRHEFRVYSGALVLVAALAIATVLGVRLDGSVKLGLEVKSWLAVVVPVGLAIVATALLWGKEQPG